MSFIFEDIRGQRSRFDSLDEAGKQYAAAGFTGHVYKEDDRPVARAESTQPEMASAAERRSAYADDGGMGVVPIHEEDAKSAEADAVALIRMGLAPSRGLFAPGTPLAKWGIDKWKTERQELDDSPTVADAAADIALRIKDERRHDVDCLVRDIKMDVKDARITIKRPGADGIGIERNGLRQLSRYGDIAPVLPHFGFVETMTRDEIVELWNARVLRVAGEARVKVRGRNGGTAGWSAYAVTGTGYGAFDIDKVASVLGEAVPDMHGALIYDADAVRLHFEVASMADMPPVVGEVWKVALKGSTADDGTGSLKFGGGFWRALCRNLTTEVLDGDVIRRIHRGAMDGIDTTIHRTVEAVMRSFAPFASKWQRLSETSAVQHFGGASMTDAITALVDGRPSLREAAAGIKRDALVEMMLRGLTDVGDAASLADIVNAVTRLHQEKVPVLVVSALEAEAGRLVNEFSAEA